MSGTKNGESIGHAWVVDGYKEFFNSYQVVVQTLEDSPAGYTPERYWGYTLVETTTAATRQLHMKWGNYNSSNGWEIMNNASSVGGYSDLRTFLDFRRSRFWTDCNCAKSELKNDSTELSYQKFEPQQANFSATIMATEKFACCICEYYASKIWRS